MDTVIGFAGKDYVLIACDTAAARSVVVMKGDQDKIMHLDPHKLLGLSGENSDAVQFSEYIQKNLNLYTLRHDITLNTKAAAAFTRGELAKALRQHPYQVNCLLGGWDKEEGPQLYFIDYLASMHTMYKAAHGYGAYFTLSVMDRHWKPNMTIDEGIQLIGKCFYELNTRFTINYPGYIVKVVDANGIRIIEPDKIPVGPA